MSKLIEDLIAKSFLFAKGAKLLNYSKCIAHIVVHLMILVTHVTVIRAIQKRGATASQTAMKTSVAWRRPLALPTRPVVISVKASSAAATRAIRCKMESVSQKRTDVTLTNVSSNILARPTRTVATSVKVSNAFATPG